MRVQAGSAGSLPGTHGDAGRLRAYCALSRSDKQGLPAASSCTVVKQRASQWRVPQAVCKLEKLQEWLSAAAMSLGSLLWKPLQHGWRGAGSNGRCMTSCQPGSCSQCSLRQLARWQHCAFKHSVTPSQARVEKSVAAAPALQRACGGHSGGLHSHRASLLCASNRRAALSCLAYGRPLLLLPALLVLLQPLPVPPLHCTQDAADVAAVAAAAMPPAAAAAAATAVGMMPQHLLPAVQPSARAAAAVAAPPLDLSLAALYLAAVVQMLLPTARAAAAAAPFAAVPAAAPAPSAVLHKLQLRNCEMHDGQKRIQQRVGRASLWADGECLVLAWSQCHRLKERIINA